MAIDFSNTIKSSGGVNLVLPEHVRENRAFWDGMVSDWVSAGERSWN